MTYLILLVLVAGGGGLIFFNMRSSSGAAAGVATRLGRYGLAGASAATATKDGKRVSGATQAADRIAQRFGWAEKLSGRMERADLKWTPGEFLAGCVALFFVPSVVGLLIFSGLGMFIGALAGLFAPWVYLWRRTKKRKRAFIEQLADIAQMMGNSMRAGFSIIQSMELVGNEASEPARHEFDRVVTEIKLGLPIDQALDHLTGRMPSEDLELMVVAINVQRQIGGNLSEILAVISHTIRERVRFERDLRALTAQARYSSYIITALPIGVGIVINFMDHPYEEMLYT